MADFAPALVLAAKGVVPTIVVGNGFCIPPPTTDFPPIRPYDIPVEAIRRTAQVAQTVRQVTGFDAPLGQLLNGDRAFIFSIPELDPYRNARAQAEYVGIHSAPFLQLGSEHGKAWGYLAENWQNYSLVVNTLKPECVFDDLKIVLREKSLAIHHGGFFTSAACLLAGIPQMVFPIDMEKWHTASSLLDLGVAISPEPLTQENLVNSLSDLSRITQTAKKQAEKFAYWNQNFLDTVVQACLQYLPV